MRIGIAVDSACDLPLDYLVKNQVAVLPITVKLGDAVVPDKRNERTTLEYLHTHLVEHGVKAQTSPLTPAQVQDALMRAMVLDYDYVFLNTIAQSRSQVFEFAQEASETMTAAAQGVRKAAGIEAPFVLRVIDTQNVFSGQGVSVVEAVRLREQGVGSTKMRARIEEIVLNTHAYMVPQDIFYLRARIRQRGDKSVSLLSAALATWLDIKPILHCNRGDTDKVGKVKGGREAVGRLIDFAIRQVEKGLMTPTLCMSYGGELSEMRSMPGYDLLIEACKAKGVEVFESVMSLTGMTTVGKGAFTLAFAAQEVPFS